MYCIFSDYSIRREGESEFGGEIRRNLKTEQNFRNSAVKFGVKNYMNFYWIIKLYNNINLSSSCSKESMRTTLKLWNSLKTLSKQRFSIFLTMFSVMLLTTFKFVCVTFTRKMVGISNTSYHNLPLFFFYFKKIHVKISSSFFVISFYFWDPH